MSAPFPIPEDNQPSSPVRRNGTRLPHGRALHAWLHPWLSASCWYYTSWGPFHPSASSGLHTTREGGFFYLWTRCHHLQTNKRGSCPLRDSTMYSCPKHPAFRAQYPFSLDIICPSDSTGLRCGFRTELLQSSGGRSKFISIYNPWSSAKPPTYLFLSLLSSDNPLTEHCIDQNSEPDLHIIVLISLLIITNAES